MIALTYDYPQDGGYADTVASLPDGRRLWINTQYNQVLARHADGCPRAIALIAPPMSVPRAHGALPRNAPAGLSIILSRQTCWPTPQLTANSARAQSSDPLRLLRSR